MGHNLLQKLSTKKSMRQQHFIFLIIAIIVIIIDTQYFA